MAKPNNQKNPVVVKRKTLSLNQIIAGTALFALGTFGVYWYTSNNRNSLNSDSGQTLVYTVPASSELVDARLNSGKRQKYLNDLIKGTDIPYCSGVVYDHDGSRIVDYLRQELGGIIWPRVEIEKLLNVYAETYRGGNYDAKTPEIVEFSAEDRTSKIFIGRQLFEKFKTLNDEDLRTIIKVHEARHVLQHAKGLGFISKDELVNGLKSGAISKEAAYDSYELDANYIALKDIISVPGHLSKSYINDTKRSFLLAYNNLNNHLNHSSETQRKMILGAIKSVEDMFSNPQFKKL